MMQECVHHEMQWRTRGYHILSRDYSCDTILQWDAEAAAN